MVFLSGQQEVSQILVSITSHLPVQGGNLVLIMQLGIKIKLIIISFLMAYLFSLNFIQPALSMNFSNLAGDTSMKASCSMVLEVLRGTF